MVDTNGGGHGGTSAAVADTDKVTIAAAMALSASASASAASSKNGPSLLSPIVPGATAAIAFDADLSAEEGAATAQFLSLVNDWRAARGFEPLGRPSAVKVIWWEGSKK